MEKMKLGFDNRWLLPPPLHKNLSLVGCSRAAVGRSSLCVRARVCSLSLLSLSSRILTQEVAAGGFRRVFGALRGAELQLVWLGWASGAAVGRPPTESPASSTLLRSPTPLPRHTTAGAAVLRAGTCWLELVQLGAGGGFRRKRKRFCQLMLLMVHQNQGRDTPGNTGGNASPSSLILTGRQCRNVKPLRSTMRWRSLR
jgi:hypothetical protein